MASFISVCSASLEANCLIQGSFKEEKNDTLNCRKGDLERGGEVGGMRKKDRF